MTVIGPEVSIAGEGTRALRVAFGPGILDRWCVERRTGNTTSWGGWKCFDQEGVEVPPGTSWQEVYRLLWLPVPDVVPPPSLRNGASLEEQIQHAELMFDYARLQPEGKTRTEWLDRASLWLHALHGRRYALKGPSR